MALIVKDRVQETSSTTGTGTLTLSGAVSGFQTFSSTIGNGNTTYYTITDGVNWEVGIGTVAAGTLSRDTVLSNSLSTTALINFSAGVKNVFCTYPADQAVTIDGVQTLTNKTLTSPTLTTPALGTPASGTLTNCTGLPNAGLVNSSITINGSSVSLGGTASVGTVTSVTGTAPVVSSGGANPDISMAAATTSVNGYLTSTDWNTFNGKYSVGGALGTPSSGTLTNCTFPTLNQNTTGSSGSCTGNAATATNATNQSGGTVSATTGAFSSGVTFAGGSKIDAAGDVYARRSNGTTGVYYFVDGTKYLYYDGSNFIFSGGNVSAPNLSGTNTGDQTNISGNAATATSAGYAAIRGGTAISAVGSAVQFTGIPSGVKRITVMFNATTHTATTVQVIQIGSGSFTTSGYVGSSWPAAGGAVGNSVGFGVAGNNLASDVVYGVMTITNISGNTWVAGVCGAVNQANLAIGGGSVTIAGVLDRVKVTSLSGAAMDGGTINIFWE